jgi:hypothetical protein
VRAIRGATPSKQRKHAGLARLVARVEAIEAELRAMLEALPAAREERDEAEDSWRPRSLAEYRRAMIECILTDDVEPLREDLQRAAGMTTEELKRQWPTGHDTG